MDTRTSHLLYIILAFVVIATNARADDEDSLAIAREQFQAGRLFPAEQAARDALDAAPDSAEIHLLLGKILIGRARFEDAESALARAAEIDPTLPGVDRELGFLRFELNDFEGAKISLERALAASPHDAEVWMRLGLCELELGRPEQAAAAFETAARDPDFASMATFNLAIAREATGDIDEARRSFERALSGGLPSSIADRAAQRLAEYPEQTRPWKLTAALGAFYESEVAQPESDQIDRAADGAAQIEVGGSYQQSIAGLNARVGYDLYQKLYFETSSFDLQSHTINARLADKFGPVSSSLGYVYSLNLLGDDQERFLDFHEIRVTAGMALTDAWYVSLTPGFRAKRFDRSIDDSRDANTAVVGLLQLFPLGEWSRYMLLGLDYEYEDADSAFDYHGLQAQLAFHIPLAIARLELPLDVRYFFRLRDYMNDASLPGSGSTRQDRGHFARARLGIPLLGPFRLLTEYEFENVDTQFDSADRTVHKVRALLQLEY